MPSTSPAHQMVIELGEKLDEMQKKVSMAGPPIKSPPATKDPASMMPTVFGVFVTLVLVCVTLGITVNNGTEIAKILDMEIVLDPTVDEDKFLDTRTSTIFTWNYCEGAKPFDPAFDNFDCDTAVANAIEQAGANVTKGYVGNIDNSATPPISTAYRAAGLCPVNVHWHLGAEHLSVGQFDEHGKGPYDSYATEVARRKLESKDLALRPDRELAGDTVRLGYQCRHYDDKDPKFTTEYHWEHCVDMMVGQTYEIHWPHSAVGACGTPYQYQTPFYDGVFCGIRHGKPILDGTIGSDVVAQAVGVQSQVFTIVNDEAYYYPDLIKGAINTAKSETNHYWSDVAIYTGSTTGTSRDNDVCSAYSPITWQVDRKCHLISASSFDKMCADMKTQVDDMAKDLYAHGARTLVTDDLASQQYIPSPAEAAALRVEKTYVKPEIHADA